ncbi:MAG TPA: lipoprotein [Steroidobacteraceae bacterium]
MRARPLIIALGIAVLLQAGGCGQKGPLFLPDKNKSAVPPPAAAPAPAPAPAPETAPVPDKDPRDKNDDSSGS